MIQYDTCIFILNPKLGVDSFFIWVAVQLIGLPFHSWGHVGVLHGHTSPKNHLLKHMIAPYLLMSVHSDPKVLQVTSTGTTRNMIRYYSTST